MKMKYYVRGFGIGVLFVTILFSLIRKPAELSDAEIRNRAAELGMFTEQEMREKQLASLQETELKWKEKLKEQETEYKALLQQKAETEQDQSSEKEGATETDIPVDKEDVIEPDVQEEPSEPEIPAEPEVTVEPEIPEEELEPGVVQFTVIRGMTSEQVSGLLQEKGLVENWADFNRYLVQRGVQSSIRVGVYRIREDADYQTIADLITSRQ